MADSIAFNEISKRVDSNEKDIGVLRNKAHEFGNAQMNQAYILERHGEIMEGLLDKADRCVDRLSNLEETTEPLKTIRKSWKSYLFTFCMFAILGMRLGSDVERIIMIIGGVLGKYIT